MGTVFFETPGILTKSFWVIHKTQKSFVNLAAFEGIRNFLSTSGYFSYIDNLVGNISRYSRKESVRLFAFGKLENSGNLRIYLWRQRDKPMQNPRCPL